VKAAAAMEMEKYINSSSPVQPIAILGAGSWGTALALYLTRREQEVYLWAYKASQAETMLAEKANNCYLPGHVFPSCLHVTSNLAAAISHSDDILIAVPSSGFRQLLLELKPLLNHSPKRIVWVTKGLDQETGQLLHEIAREILGSTSRFAILSGPSFASEVARGLPTAVVIASHDASFANDLLQRFNGPLFRIYLSEDVTGVEIGGIVKNVLAIATGIADGMQLGSNARSVLITRGLAEMIRLGITLGGQYETFTGLAGLGDLVLTCTDNQSRNRRYGLALGSGKSKSEAEQAIGQAIEGKRNAELVVQLAHKQQVEMPIVEIVWKILQEKITLQEAMQTLVSRNPKTER
jgi:glycerol-3-phosphate dehydrogenase (NAD(P)+)